MEHRVMQPASREQIVAIIRQRAERQNPGVMQGVVQAAANPAQVFGAFAGPAGGGGGQGAAPLPAGQQPILPPQFGLPHANPFIGQANGPGGGVAAANGGAVARARLPPGGEIFQDLMAIAGEGRRPVMMGPYMANLLRQASVSKEEAPRTRNLSVQGNVVSFKPEQEHAEAPGVYVGGKNMSIDMNYFEVEIAEKGASRLSLSIGIVSRLFSLENLPGRHNDSYAFCPGDGYFFNAKLRGTDRAPFGPRPLEVGDKVGCGIKFNPPAAAATVAGGAVGKNGGPMGPSSVLLFFTHNGKEFATVPVDVPPGGFFPAISLTEPAESFVLRMGLRYIQEEDIMMMVDNCDDDWLSLHDIRLNGPVLEYIGRGKSLVDVGLAQAKHPISTRHHYFEIEIVDPGLRCYIAIGLARKDYPKNRHPGWNRGSIAYHADDGKVFVGSGVGAPFGPPCHKGDIMGCGVLFPRNYEYRSDSDDDPNAGSGSGGGSNEGDPLRPPSPAGGGAGIIHLGGNGGLNPNFDYRSDSADDEDWWSDRNYLPYGVKVHIYFTRNGNVIGKREVRIPKGGFYPTVGMMSSDEKVRVDLRPLSG